jgi:selenocysteine lyase/cysteine desulfurase
VIVADDKDDDDDNAAAPPAAPVLIPNQRALFSVPPRVTYLNNAYMSPSLRAADDAGRRGIDLQRDVRRITPSSFFDETERLRAALAQLLNCPASHAGDDVALVPSVSYGSAIARRNLPHLRAWRRNGNRATSHDTIVTIEEQYPSNYYEWQAAVDETVGARMVQVPRCAQGGGFTQSVLDAIDERTALVAVPQCHWTDGSALDLARIGERARAAGAHLFVDATQSAGVYPLDVQRIKPDYVAVALYKWCLGAYGSGMLYVAPGELQDAGEPIELSWLNRAGSEDFAGLVNYQSTYQRGARRFDVGERCNFVTLPMTRCAIEQVLAWGVPNIAHTLAQLQRHARDAIAAHPVLRRRVRVLDGALPHFIGLRFVCRERGEPLPDSSFARHVYQALFDNDMFVSARGDCVRITPHLFNSAADVDKVLDAIARILQQQEQDEDDK